MAVLAAVVVDQQALVEYRYRAVREVLGGAPIGEVAARYGTSRQSVHAWRKRFEAEGTAGLTDRSRRPKTSPTRLSAEVEAVICELVTVVIEDTHFRILHGDEELAVKPRRNPGPITRLYVRGKSTQST